jgi:hypothetical protein
LDDEFGWKAQLKNTRSEYYLGKYKDLHINFLNTYLGETGWVYYSHSKHLNPELKRIQKSQISPKEDPFNVDGLLLKPKKINPIIINDNPELRDLYERMAFDQNLDQKSEYVTPHELLKIIPHYQDETIVIMEYQLHPRVYVPVVHKVKKQTLRDIINVGLVTRTSRRHQNIPTVIYKRETSLYDPADLS